MKKWIVILLRLTLGAVFVLSGGAKSIDPWGTVFKISEYLTVWGLHDIPDSIITVGAFLLGGYEFVCGSLLLLGCYRRGSVIALSLLMAAMLPLSLYIAVNEPVADCGCFGDALVISNTATFIKNIFICAGLGYLLVFNRRVSTFVTPYVQWIAGGWLTLYILVIGLVGYNIQPLLDFRRFAPETALADGDETDDDTISSLLFTYERDGEQRDFTLDAIPDSTWTFVERKSPAAVAPTDRFIITDPETGEDLTEEVLTTGGGPDLFIITIPDIGEIDLSATYLLNDLNDFIVARAGKLVMLTGLSATPDDIDAWRDVSMASYPIYRTDTRQIKELARGNAALVYVTDGIVKWKRTLHSISYSQVTETPDDMLIATLDPMPTRTLSFLTWGFLGGLMLLVILDRTGYLVHLHLRRRRPDKKQEKH